MMLAEQLRLVSDLSGCCVWHWLSALVGVSFGGVCVCVCLCFVYLEEAGGWLSAVSCKQGRLWVSDFVCRLSSAVGSCCCRAACAVVNLLLCVFVIVCVCVPNLCLCLYCEM